MNQLLPFIMRTWLYASGVFFSIPARVDDLPESLSFIRYVLELNPAAAYIELMRDLLIHDHSPPQWAWVTAIFWAVFALIVGFWYFWRAEERYGRG
jgi:teichoic acid transport system permease protein